jgi:hypothetical protein
MAKASKKSIGPGAHGKRDGSGAKIDIDKDKIPENIILSNRDKAAHSSERGLDSKQIQSEQLQDHKAGR